VWDLLAGGALDTISLSNGAADLRKHVAGVRPDQPDRPHHNYEDYREHDRIFGNVLTFFVQPEITQRMEHILPRYLGNA
jgi:hypothetical protein